MAGAQRDEIFLLKWVKTFILVLMTKLPIWKFTRTIYSVWNIMTEICKMLLITKTKPAEKMMKTKRKQS